MDRLLGVQCSNERQRRHFVPMILYDITETSTRGGQEGSVELFGSLSSSPSIDLTKSSARVHQRATVQAMTGVRVGLIFLFVLGMTISACDARIMVDFELSGEASDNHNNACAMCNKYVTVAFDYLENNNTQTEIIEALHMSCAQFPPLKEQCLSVVDYFAQLFFKKLSLIQTDEVCRKFDLCEAVVALASEAQRSSCDACHETVSEFLAKLKDPETKLKIIRQLLKRCKSFKACRDKCKKMVFEYGPVILANVEKFLEKTDICAILHTCPALNSESQDATAVADS